MLIFSNILFVFLDYILIFCRLTNLFTEICSKRMNVFRKKLYCEIYTHKKKAVWIDQTNYENNIRIMES